MKYSGPETRFLAYCTFVRVAANPISGTKELYARLFSVSISPPSPGGHMAWCQPGKGGDFLVRQPRSNHMFSLSFQFNCLSFCYGESQSAICKEFSLSNSTVATIWKNRDSISAYEKNINECKRLRKAEKENVDGSSQQTEDDGEKDPRSKWLEKHGVNAFSQNKIDHFESCDDDVITSGEVSEEVIVALVNEKKTLL
ncbi:hypothetical protein AVEN_13495-1 [Araneus ventricosus]|uniref:HTH psq-type domain-containing protein n=1 Tax=Araneus ventricosus TaxID=182803 RepID=A0A4Y2TD28_ARAVE|nr:hypothetical protein AVEN_13495-1 [Araneus ventricosus]